MTRRLHLLIFVAFSSTVVLGGVWSQPAAAAPACPKSPTNEKAKRKLANRLYKEGIRSFKAGRYKKAYRAFRCTQKIIPASLTMFWIGRCAQKLGDYGRAARAFERVLEEPPSVVDVDELKKRIRMLRKKAGLGKASGRQGARRGGRSKGRRSRAHPRGRAGARGKGRAGRRLGHGAKQKHSEERRRKRKWMRIGAWSSWSASAALIIAATAMGSVALHDRTKIENASDGTWWDPKLEDRYQRRPGLVAGTWVCFGLAAGAAAAGTVLYLLSSKEEESQTTVSVVPLEKGGMAGVRVQY
jgi:hypothetical protein